MKTEAAEVLLKRSQPFLFCRAILRRKTPKAMGENHSTAIAMLFMPRALLSACATQGHHTMALSTPLFREQYTARKYKEPFKISATESRKDRIKRRQFSTACVIIITFNLQGNSVVLNTRVCLFQLLALGERLATPACHHIDSCAVICALISSKWPRRAL